MYDIDELKRIRQADDYTFVLAYGDRLETSTARGVRPIIVLIQSSGDFSHGVVVDKVVGRAAALLYALMGVERLHALVVSEPAAAVCRAHGIALTYDALVPNIINRSGDDICPMEKLTLEIDDPQAALRAIEQKLAAMHA